MNLIHQLDHLFNPRSVAVIGASNIPGKWGCDILQLLLTRGGRQVFAINKNRSEVLGVKTYRSMDEVPYPVDLSVITVSSEAVTAAMEDCVLNGVKTALVISSGFAETGEEGAKAEAALAEIAGRGGLRFTGPNCAGHFNTAASLFTAPYLPPVKEGPVAFVSQSGNLGLVVLAMAHESGLGFSKYVSSGNEADLRFEDYLEYLGQDNATKIILGYVEGFRESRRFLELAGGITKKKPVVIMKVGSTECGARAASSHTAALSGSDRICDAAFRQSGVIRAGEVRDLIDVALILLGQPLPRGKKVAVLTVGGGLGIIATDALRNNGIELSTLSPATIERLNGILPTRWSRGNPVDTSGYLSYPCLLPLLEDEDVNSVLVAGPVWAPVGFSALISTPPWERDYRLDAESLLRSVEEESLRNLDTILNASRSCKKPVIFSTWVSDAVKGGDLYKKLQQNYLIPYPTPDRAARALATLTDYSDYLGFVGKGH